MKRFNYFALIAAAAFIVSCEVSEPFGPHDGMVPYIDPAGSEPEWSEFIFTSDQEDISKTVFTGETIYWSAGDKIRMGYTVDGVWQGVSANQARLYESDPLSSGGPSASFTVPGQFNSSTTGEHKFYTVYPSSASEENFSSAPLTTLTVPTEQTPAADSFDPAADLMIGHSVGTYTSRPTEAVPLMWERLIAHGEITLKKLSEIEGFSADEEIVGITLKAQSDATLTGSFLYDFSTKELEAYDASNIVSVKGDNLSWDNGTLTFWIGIMPQTLTSLEVTLETDKATYVKSYSGFTKPFTANARNVLGISMKGAARTSTTVPAYVKVTENLTDWSGQYVLGFDNGTVKKMLTGISNTSTKYGIATDVAITDNTIAYEDGHPYEITIAKSGSYYTLSFGGKYLSWYSGNSLILADSPTDNSNGGKWTISYSNGTLTISNANTSTRLLQYNEGDPRFACYTSAQAAPSLYKLNETSGGSTDPVATATVTTEVADNIVQTSATLNGSFSGATGTISEVGFYWGTSNNNLSTRVVVSNTTTSPFSYELTGLDPNTTYYFKAFVKEYDGVQGSDVEITSSVVQSFTTEAEQQSGGDYELVTASQSDWSGAYVLGYLDSSTSAILLIGTSNTSTNYGTVNNNNPTSVNNGVIAASAGSPYEITIAKSGNYYTLYLTGVGYLGWTSGNSLAFASSAGSNNYEWSISYSNGTLTITNAVLDNNVSRILKYNTGSPRYACYLATSTAAQPKAPSLFKRAGSSTPQVTVTTEAVSNLANTSVTLNGSYVVPTGLSVTERGFYFGTGSDPTTKITVSGTDTSFSISKTGLTKGTAYSYKAYAIESDGTTTTTRYGEVVYFTTTGGSQVTYQYLSDYGMPDISGLGVSLRTSGTNSDRDDKWYSYNTNNNKRQIAVHTYSTGAPNNSETCNYVVLYDETKYAPVWTAHTMNSTYWPDNNAGRNNSWTNDPAISLTQQTGLDNASTVGYSRGHLVASNYRQTTDEQNKQTFYYSNQAPQWQNSFNSGVWSSLETRVVEMTPSGTTMLYVITGVLYEGTITTLSSGSLNVPIPSHFYKCIMRCTFSGGTISGAQGIAFVYTNEAHSGNYYNSAFVTTIDAIEARAGFDFFSAVPTTYQTSAESNTNHTWFTGQN